ncbi:unnamed protein product [Arabidopsis thaliana]|uniref:Uncharacterized protein n=1 Tax=Arabidopsis thaliana TaxID=3702 RepID=A0A654EG20_ARATH|nr:unnamed protein product [Arabidopsis thaliana]
MTDFISSESKSEFVPFMNRESQNAQALKSLSIQAMTIKYIWQYLNMRSNKSPLFSKVSEVAIHITS